MTRYIFHLSIPVDDLASAKQFYVSELEAEIGRETEGWIDVLLWGHQITLQLEPEQVGTIEEQGKRHFGVVLPWSEWHRLSKHFAGQESLKSAPVIKHEGTDSEQAKLYLKDPSNNIIEVKAYRDFQKVLGTDDPTYGAETV